MKKIRILSLFVLLILISGAFTLVQDRQSWLVGSEEFRKYADTEGMEFSMPDGFSATRIYQNPDLNYEFAMVSDEGDIEVRYSIFSLKDLVAQFNKCWEEKDTNCRMANPNEYFVTLGSNNVDKMTNGRDFKITAFPEQSVKREFNADNGGTCFIEFDCEFGGKYPYGQFIILHRHNVADAIITFMFYDKRRVKELVTKPFYSLRFKP